ncbi:MAG: TetR/AcrR family transcriptional regulator [Kiloniellales bacterium]
MAEGHSAGGKRLRLSREERRNQILDRAVAFFSVHGFGASTRDLAKSAGVTQPLLYNYFPSKEALVRAVYERVYVDRWQPEWDAVLTDRSQALEDRLIAFYTDYTRIIYDPDWLRLYLYSGLRALDINKWYIARVEARVIHPICREIRAAYGLPQPADGAVAPAEAEAIWTFHGGIVYYGIRREIYKIPEKTTFDEMIRSAVGTLLKGASLALTSNHSEGR